MSDSVRAAQALAILEQLERIPPGRSLRLYNSPSLGFTAIYDGRVHHGADARDALGQLTTVLALDEGDEAAP